MVCADLWGSNVSIGRFFETDSAEQIESWGVHAKKCVSQSIPKGQWKNITKQHDAKQRWNKQIWKMLISTQIEYENFSVKNRKLFEKSQKMENPPKQAKNPPKMQNFKKMTLVERVGCSGHLRDASGRSPGHLRTSPGQLRDNSGTCPGHLRDKFENLWNFMPKMTFHLVLFPLEGANAIFEFSAECCRFCLIYLDAFAIQIKSLNIRCIGPFSFTLAARMFARFVFRFKMKIKF